MKNSNIAIIGSNYGDEGKGRTVDYFAKQFQEQDKKCIVIRHSGSNNASHTVYLNDNTHHAFSSIGSGSFRNADTYLSRHFVVDLLALQSEIFEVVSLHQDFTNNYIYLDERCRVVTPYDVAKNRIKEFLRSSNKHGSTGNGFNETIDRFMHFPLIIGNILSNGLDLLEKIREDFIEFVHTINPNALNLMPAGLRSLIDFCIKHSSHRTIWIKMTEVLECDILDIHRKPNLKEYNCIFEGSQGLLLDEYYGQYPYVTRSRTGVLNVIDICREFDITLDEVHYLSRAYLSRHGRDPNFDSSNHEDVLKHFDIVDVTNVRNDWQDAMVYDFLNLHHLEDRINHDFSYAIKSYPNCTQHRVFSCVDQIKTMKVLESSNVLYSGDSFKEYVNDYYGSLSYVKSILFHESAVNK